MLLQNSSQQRVARAKTAPSDLSKRYFRSSMALPTSSSQGFQVRGEVKEEQRRIWIMNSQYESRCTVKLRLWYVPSLSSYIQAHSSTPTVLITLYFLDE